MKFIYLFLFCFLYSESKAQISDSVQTYYLSKEVRITYSSDFAKKIYQKSISDFDLFKQEAIRKMHEGIDLAARLKKDSNYLLKLEDLFKNPNEVNRLSRALGLEIYIDEIPVSTYDTTGNRLWYERTLDASYSKDSSKTICYYTIDQLLSGPTEQESAYNPLLDFSNVIDGSYVMYYQPIYSDKLEGFHKNIPYCNFSVLNKKIDGSLVFLYPNGDTLSYGHFVNGNRDGLWKMYLPIISRTGYSATFFVTMNGTDLEPIKDKVVYSFEYRDGILNGEYFFSENGVLRANGKFENNVPVGKWEVYHKNGQLSNRIHFIRTPSIIPATVIYPKIIGTVFINERSRYVSELPSGTMYLVIPGLVDQLVEQEPSVYEEKWIKLYEFGLPENNLVYKLYFTGVYEAYYDNGNLFFKLTISEDGKSISFPREIYDRNGGLIQKWKLNKKGSKGRVVYYLPDGSRQIYKVGKHGYKQVFPFIRNR